MKDFEYTKTCIICDKPFETNWKPQQTCGWECRQKKAKENSRLKSREKRKNIKCKPCIVCGFDLTTDIHHEGKKTYILCPNHHALITRGKKQLEELIENKQ